MKDEIILQRKEEIKKWLAGNGINDCTGLSRDNEFIAFLMNEFNIDREKAVKAVHECCIAIIRDIDKFSGCLATKLMNG